MSSSAAPLTNSEKKACIALSRLFLDTEITPNFLEEIAASLQPFKMCMATLSHLLHHDVFPVLYRNLISTAGGWEQFEEEWLLREIERRRTISSWVGYLGSSAAWYTVGHMVTSSCNQVEEKLQMCFSRFCAFNVPPRWSASLSDGADRICQPDSTTDSLFVWKLAGWVNRK